MTSNEFSAALRRLRWKQIDFCRKTDTAPGTASKYATVGPIPGWVPHFLGAMLRLKELHDDFVLPEKPGKVE
jgi:hypothetical protein